MPETARFTAAEAAFVLREPVRSVKKALDTGPIRPMLLHKSGTPVRAIDRSELIYLYLVRALSSELTPKARSDLYDVLKKSKKGRPRTLQVGRLRIDVSDLIDEVDKRTAQLTDLAEQVDFRNDGEPLIRGTDIEIYRISALLAGGMSVEEILEDYPGLSRGQIETAESYARVYPKQGRPYPPITAKRAMRHAGVTMRRAGVEIDEILGDDAPE